MADEVEQANYAANQKKAAPIGGLFEIQFPAPSVPSSSSEAAADRLTHTQRGIYRRAKQLLRVLEVIASRESGYSLDELDGETSLGTGALCARIDDLRTAGLIDTSETIRRKTRRGVMAKVHFVTPAGRARLKAAA